MLVRSLALCVLSVAALDANSITTSVTGAAGPLSATDAHACSLVYPGTITGRANATSDVSVSFAGSSGDPFVLTVTQTANAVTGITQDSTHYATNPTAAIADAAVGLTLQTEGVPRAGYMLISGDAHWTYTAGESEKSAAFTVGTITGACEPYGDNECGLTPVAVPVDPSVFPHSYLVPFALGTAFPLEFSQHMAAYGDAADGQALLPLGTTTLSLQFFELDGVTPVGVFDPPSTAPEPATWTLLCSGFALALFFRRKIRV